MFKLQAKSMLVSIDRLQKGRVKKLIGRNHRSSCGESILKYCCPIKSFFDRYAVLLERAKIKGLISFCEVSP